MTVDAPRVHLGLSAGGRGKVQPGPVASGAVGELVAGSAPARNRDVLALEKGVIGPERSDSADTPAPATAGCSGPEVPEQPDTWGTARPAPSDREGAAGDEPPEGARSTGPELRQSGGPMSAEAQLDSLLEQGEGAYEGESLPTTDGAARPGDSGPGRARRGTGLDPEPPNPANTARAQARVPLTSDWDPASFPADAPWDDKDRVRGAPRRGVRGMGEAAVPAEMDDSDPRTHVLEWMKKRFDGLGEALQILASGASRQQETLELLVDRQAELESRLEQAESSDDSGPGRVSGRGRRRPGKPVLDDRAADLLGIASDELGRLVDEVVTALQEAGSATASSVAAQNENTERLRLLQAAVTKQLRAITASVGEWEQRSEERLAVYSRRVEALAKRLPDGPTRAKAAGTAKLAAASKDTGTVKAGRTAKVIRAAKRAPAPGGRDPRPTPRH